MAEPALSPDAELVHRARRGDHGAFEALVKKFQERVYRTAYHMTRNHGDADDVAQESFLRAYRGLAGFDERAEFGTWLHRIVINAALNTLRARRRRGRTEPAEVAEALPARETDPAERTEAREEAEELLAALESLSPTLRDTLIMATLEDMPYKEIAQTLGIPEGTVAWRVNQARKTLRKRLAARALDGEGDVDEVLRRTKEALGAP